MMKKNRILIALLLGMLLIIGGCAAQDKTPQTSVQPTIELNISAAASLTDAAKELEQLYKEEHPEVKLVYNLAASGTLQKQIEEGAPADVFISAGKKQMDALQEGGFIVNDSRQNLLGNELVLIVPKDSKIETFDDLVTDKAAKISIGTPETVPAGKYAQEALTNLNLWGPIQPKLVMAKDVRQVLTYVESENVDAGLVYRSDTIGSEKTRIAAAAPADSHSPIVYPMAIVAASQQQEAAQEFVTFLTGEKAKIVFEKYGFKNL